MSRSTGLRTEIIVNMVFLIGASLLLTGFLVLNYHERELLLRRVESMVVSLELLTGSISVIDEPAVRADETARLMNVLGNSLSDTFSVESWVYTDRALHPLASSGKTVSDDDLNRAKRTRDTVIQTSYPSFWDDADPDRGSFCVVTIPLLRYGDADGLVQARFSLEDVRASVATARRLILLYAFLYGTILTLFGIWLINRTVVRPVRRLSDGTRRVADGDLVHLLPIEGPGEIADMAESFNSMTASLRRNREEIDEHIASLKEANEVLKKTRADLVQSEKMAAVGHLAAGIAHEVGNPLAALTGYLDYLKGEKLSDVVADVVDRSHLEAQRIDRLVKDLLDYAAPGKGEPDRVDVISVVRETLDLLTAQGAFEGLSIEAVLPESLPDIVGQRHKLQQVFVNLLLNARDASPPGGTIRFSALSGEGRVSLRIKDEGAGIDPETLTRLFDPFYTTKAPGEGRGLGLFVCHRIVDEMGGKIVVESEEGRGSRFEVHLKAWRPDHDA